MLESNHKLITFILKNPPNLNPATQGSSLTEGKRSKRSKKTNGETNGEVKDGDTSELNDTGDNHDTSATNNVRRLRLKSIHHPIINFVSREPMWKMMIQNGQWMCPKKR